MTCRFAVVLAFAVLALAGTEQGALRHLDAAAHSRGHRRLKRACDGIMMSSFHTGQNDNATTYTDIKHVFKSAASIEGFAAAASKKTSEGTREQRAKQATAQRRGRRHET